MEPHQNFTCFYKKGLEALNELRRITVKIKK